MTTATVLSGDVRQVIRTLPERSVQVAVTSPPYWGLRDYGTAQWEGGDPACNHKPGSESRVGVSTLQGGKKTSGHQAEGHRNICRKCGAVRVDNQIGLERTPDLYVKTMVGIGREIWRVLKDDGIFFLNLGDSYYGGKGKSSQAWSQSHPDRPTLQRARDHVAGLGEIRVLDMPQPGLKPKDLCMIPARVALALQAAGWWLRMDLVWFKTNSKPESVTDRPTRAHEYIFMLTKSKRYYYDADAIAELANYDGRKDTRMKGSPKYNKEMLPGSHAINSFARDGNERWRVNESGEKIRNARSVWVIPTLAYEGAHVATMAPEVARRCILAGSRPGDVVLDPFNGAGTTGMMAVENGRHYVGIELNPEYILETRKRLRTTQPKLIGG